MSTGMSDATAAPASMPGVKERYRESLQYAYDAE